MVRNAAGPYGEKCRRHRIAAVPVAFSCVAYQKSEQTWAKLGHATGLVIHGIVEGKLPGAHRRPSAIHHYQSVRKAS